VRISFAGAEADVATAADRLEIWLEALTRGRSRIGTRALAVAEA